MIVHERIIFSFLFTRGIEPLRKSEQKSEWGLLPSNKITVILYITINLLPVRKRSDRKKFYLDQTFFRVNDLAIAWKLALNITFKKRVQWRRILILSKIRPRRTIMNRRWVKPHESKIFAFKANSLNRREQVKTKKYHLNY